VEEKYQLSARVVGGAAGEKRRRGWAMGLPRRSWRASRRGLDCLVRHGEATGTRGGRLGKKTKRIPYFFSSLIFPWALFVIGLCVSYGIAGGTLLDLGRKRIRFNPRSAGWPSFTSFTSIALLY
jgi:hypothetical protein